MYITWTLDYSFFGDFSFFPKDSVMIVIQIHKNIFLDSSHSEVISLYNSKCMVRSDMNFACARFNFRGLSRLAKGERLELREMSYKWMAYDGLLTLR